jgi:UDP-N-acetylmuramyl-tripeptide synthetase
MKEISSYIEENFRKFNIKNISIDSRYTNPQTAFFILDERAEKYLNQAQENGCKLIISYRQFLGQSPEILEYLREAINYLYNQKPKYVVSVTGTNGKTSVVNFYQQIISNCGYKSCSIGTLGVKSNDDEFNKLWSAFSGLTTNDAITTNKILSSAKEHGIEHVSLEASSHGIVQNRLLGIKFSSIALTNISHDHLDYHGSMEAYKEAKMSLFCDKYMSDECRIITNLEEEDFKKYNSVILGKNFHYKIIDKSLCGTAVEFEYNAKKYNFKTNLIGEFQINNLIISMLMSENSGIDMDDVCNSINKINPIKGRMQKIIHKNNFIFIDYAHTPDGLEVVLKELKSLKKDSAKIISVFGCGGDRDKSKRPIMGMIASKYSDVVVLTNDNPRSENPESIIKDIRMGCENDAIEIIEIEDRESAIVKGIGLLSENDVLLIAGKGHEEYQIINDKKIFLSDENIVMKNIMW